MWSPDWELRRTGPHTKLWVEPSGHTQPPALGLWAVASKAQVLGLSPSTPFRSLPLFS